MSLQSSTHLQIICKKSETQTAKVKINQWNRNSNQVHHQRKKTMKMTAHARHRIIGH